MLISENNNFIHWIEIYPMDSAIHLLINWGRFIYKITCYYTSYVAMFGEKVSRNDS